MAQNETSQLGKNTETLTLGYLNIAFFNFFSSELSLM